MDVSDIFKFLKTNTTITIFTVSGINQKKFKIFSKGLQSLVKHSHTLQHICTKIHSYNEWLPRYNVSKLCKYIENNYSLLSFTLNTNIIDPEFEKYLERNRNNRHESRFVKIKPVVSDME